jgi:serine phosphatase RsbU (regulator of sigma subunit)
MPDAEYETGLVKLEPGDRIYLYSDGLTESENDDGEFFDLHRLLEGIEAAHGTDLETSVQSVLARARRWRKHRSPEDDLTLVGLEVS